jgi:hypothetical protein
VVGMVVGRLRALAVVAVMGLGQGRRVSLELGWR